MIHNHHMGHVARKANCVACEQQSRRPDCSAAQSDQRLCYSLLGKYNFIATFCNLYFSNILVSFCSLIDWFESYLDGIPETGFLAPGPIYYHTNLP